MLVAGFSGGRGFPYDWVLMLMNHQHVTLTREFGFEGSQHRLA